MQMWQTGRAESQCRCEPHPGSDVAGAQAEPSPGADLAGASPSPVQMCFTCDLSLRWWGRGFVVWALLGISGQGSAEVQASWLKARATTHRDARGLEREVELADPLPQRKVGVFLQASLRRAARVRCTVSVTHALCGVDRVYAAGDWGHSLFSSATPGWSWGPAGLCTGVHVRACECERERGRECEIVAVGARFLLGESVEPVLDAA